MTRPVARIAADSRPVLFFTVALTAAVALASFALSFASLRDAALWGRVPEPIAFLVPVVIDASVLVYGLVALVLRARGRSSAWAWTLMLLFTVVSIGANSAHAYDVGPQLRALVGVVLVALAPLSVLTSTHALASLVVTDEPAEVEPVDVPEVSPVLATARVLDAVAAPAESPAAPAIAPAESSGPPAPARVPALGPLAPVRSGLSRRVAQDTLPGFDGLDGLDVAGATA
ncbi:DUF2637 domain-containing protein [Antribacter sp. KLBMP9083]|uniref:DUF2637 domain-containing protein n=1 Tax=Antribacter soli TaxID=2910976 RepID=A0AA41QFK4_9MICO|nr:DUF2637 domain-containing protein [Antribacter soli]MCF4121746.1 DUF2637 domain-containing protein [Antribacter soli]